MGLILSWRPFGRALSLAVQERLAIEKEVKLQDEAELMGNLLSSAERHAAGTLSQLEARWAAEDAERQARRQADIEKRAAEEIVRLVWTCACACAFAFNRVPCRLLRCGRPTIRQDTCPSSHRL